jgi:hypothetical protein
VRQLADVVDAFEFAGGFVHHLLHLGRMDRSVDDRLADQAEELPTDETPIIIIRPSSSSSARARARLLA